MPLSKLQFRPGVNKEGTRYSSEGGWYDCDKVRFRSGNPEKIGGWIRQSASTFVGLCRALWAWTTLSSMNLIGVGTVNKYYINLTGTYYDVTPLRDFMVTGTYNRPGASAVLTVTITSTATMQTGDSVTLTFTSGTALNADYTITVVTTTTFTVTTVSTTATAGNVTISQRSIRLSNPFATVSGSTTITVTHTAHGASDGDYVTFSGATGFNGVAAAEFNAEKVIIYVDANTYRISVTSTASATSSGGGTVTAKYQVSGGSDTAVTSPGWGTGSWNQPSTTWGQTTSLGITGVMRVWTHDNFGQNLLMAPRNNTIYYWVWAADYTFQRAVYLKDAASAAGYDGRFVPTQTLQIIASDQQRFVVALGANSYSSSDAATTFDPMLVRWADQENPYEWIPAVTNQAGEQRLTNGSTIRCGVISKQEILIWTDAALYSMQYLGPPYVFGFTQVSTTHSVISSRAAVVVQDKAFWMGPDNFYIYNGTMMPLNCTLWRYVYKNISTTMTEKFFAAKNEQYDEIWWFYCSETATEIDRYVIYNYLTDIWYHGTLVRTAWIDASILGNPLAATTTKLLVYHEAAVDDESTGTAVAIDAYIESSDFDIGDGNNFAFVWRVIPDIEFDGSTDGTTPAVTMTMSARTGSGSANTSVQGATVITPSVYPVNTYTEQIMTRVRGRQMSFKVGSNKIGTQWQLGAPRIDVRPDGRKS